MTKAQAESKVKELQAAIEKLPARQRTRLVRWLAEREAASQEDRNTSVDQPGKRATYSFADLAGVLKWEGDALAEQRRLRDEW